MAAVRTPSLLRRALLLIACIALPLAARAQSGDTPPWLVGRVSYHSGSVQILQTENGSGEESDWRPARVNDVVTTGTVVSTDGGGRAEVRVGQIAYRLGGVTDLAFQRIDGDGVHAQLDRGTVALRVRQVDRDLPLRVLTPNAQIEIQANGRYRIDANGTASSTLTVFAGRAVVAQGDSRLMVDANRSLTVAGAPPSFNYGGAMSTTLDEWALARDERERDVRATRYVSPYMTGYEDLDAYGEWRVDVTYGTVWYPRAVPVGWAPYRYGHWGWVSPWGWTWIDDAPWGFAPFHYGRWVYVGGAWGWWPGAYVARPWYAPALVSFVGGGPHWGVSVSVGAPLVGWYPLAPWEPYHPIYVTNVIYVNNVNRIVTRPPIVRDKQHHEALTRAQQQAGLTAVPSRVMSQALPVSQHVAPETRRLVREPQAFAPLTSSAALPARPLHNVTRSAPQAPATPAPGAAAPRTGQPVAPVRPERVPGGVERPAQPATPAAPARPAVPDRGGRTVQPHTPAAPASPAVPATPPAVAPGRNVQVPPGTPQPERRIVVPPRPNTVPHVQPAPPVRTVPAPAAPQRPEPRPMPRAEPRLERAEPRAPQVEPRVPAQPARELRPAPAPHESRGVERGERFERPDVGRQGVDRGASR